MTSEQKNIVTKGVVVGVVGFGAYYLYTVFARQMGIVTSTANVAAPKSLFAPLSKTDTTVNKSTTSTASLVDLSTVAHDIYYALHYFWADDWATVWAGFQKMKTQDDVTAMAQLFYGSYGVDLWSYLQDGGGIWILGDGLSDVHLQQLHAYVEGLPGSASTKKGDTGKKNTKKTGKNTGTDTNNLINQGQNLLNQGQNLLGSISYSPTIR